MPVKKVPVEAVKGAGPVSMTLFPIITTCFTIVAHGVDIFGRGYVRFGGDLTAVGELTHGPGVRQLHPLNGINAYK